MVGSPLVDVDELRSLLAGARPVTVLDVRHRMGGPGGRAEFERGHVPGATYVDLDADLASPPGEGGRHPLPTAGGFEAAMRRVGVRDDVPVVVYDDWAGHAAARCWWLLRWCGHGDVRVLDGAWPAWQRDGGQVASGPDAPRPGDFTARPGAMPVVGAAEVPGVGVLVDARSPERWRGEAEPVDPVAGRIPGAVNVPTARNLGEDGRFRPADALARLYTQVGAVAGADVAAYCGSGVTAAHDVLAMELAGVRAALYPGSWSGWITDPGRPVERG